MYSFIKPTWLKFVIFLGLIFIIIRFINLANYTIVPDLCMIGRPCGTVHAATLANIYKLYSGNRQFLGEYTINYFGLVVAIILAYLISCGVEIIKKGIKTNLFSLVLLLAGTLLCFCTILYWLVSHSDFNGYFITVVFLGIISIVLGIPVI